MLKKRERNQEFESPMLHHRERRNMPYFKGILRFRLKGLIPPESVPARQIPK